MKSLDIAMIDLGIGLRPVAMKLAAASMMVLSLTACRSEYDGVRVAGFGGPTTIEERHPIIVDKATASLELTVTPESSGLTVMQRADVQEFIGNWRNKGSGRLLVQAPRGSGNQAAAYKAASEIRDLVREAGLRTDQADFRAYRAHGTSPSVKLVFQTHVAHGPQCGVWAENLAESKHNDNYENFGCAAQANLAAMIDNPADLLFPRRMTPRPGQRRDAAFTNFDNGKNPTSSTKSEESKGAVSQVSN